MPWPLIADVLFAGLAAAGHGALAIYFITRLHATGWDHRVLKAIDWVWLAAVPALPLAIARGYATGAIGLGPFSPSSVDSASWPPALALAATGYLAVCQLAGLVALPWWLCERWQLRASRCPPAASRVIDLAAGCGEPLVEGFVPRLLAALPLNESLQLEVNEKDIALARLPAELDGLSIVHISDLHLTGKLTPAFYRRIIRETNSLGGDLIAITGDLVERDECLPWLELFGELAAPLGVYFILGNHDLRVSDPAEIRRRLTAAGLIDLGGGSHSVTHRGRPLFLAGNEAPWFPVDAAARVADGAVGVLLSHTPDQLPWARERGFDLMLAGHMHGGQVAFPWIGPVIGPSFHGVYYAEGLFAEPPTTLHVSRGVAALHPYRLGAPPEITRLVLRSAAEAKRQSSASRATSVPLGVEL